jgi:hypothetical protein
MDAAKLGGPWMPHNAIATAGGAPHGRAACVVYAA